MVNENTNFSSTGWIREDWVIWRREGARWRPADEKNNGETGRESANGAQDWPGSGTTKKEGRRRWPQHAYISGA